MTNNTDSTNPVEVDIVNRVKTCRACQWFWGGVLPYGPYPSFEWLSDYPKEFRQQHPQTVDRQPPSLIMQAKALGYNPVDPAIMHGCRKAPIMTIGINPNMTSYFASTAGARWCYPHFEDPAQYAYYYRHQTIFQESFSLEYIRDHICRDTAIRAEQPGWLKEVNRCKDHRWMELVVQYEGASQSRTIEVAWSPGERFVILVPEKDSQKPPPSFQQGDVIAAKLKNPVANKTSLFENTVGYYQRFLPVLAKLSDHITDKLSSSVDKNTTNTEKVTLRIGEDVSQHDMIGCASPGWSSTYDIPTSRIAENCVHDKAFAMQQILQSRPAVIVLVGKSTLKMFGRYYGAFLDLDYLEPDPADPDEVRVKDVFHLLSETCARRKHLTIAIDDYSLRSRVIVCPHFSYYENYFRQARFSAEVWTAFQKNFPDDVAILKQRKLLKENGFNNVTAVKLEKRKELQSQLSVAAWKVLMAYYYDPNRMIADALIEEYQNSSLSFDPATGRLNRTDGACNFCSNSYWKFPENGCRYGNTDDTGHPPEYYIEIINNMTKGSA